MKAHILTALSSFLAMLPPAHCVLIFLEALAHALAALLFCFRHEKVWISYVLMMLFQFAAALLQSGFLSLGHG